MKKIVSLFLVVLCVFSFVACKDEPDPLESFKTALAATPVSAEIEQQMVVLGITLDSKYAAAYAADGTVSVSYTVEKLNSIPTDGTLPGELVREEAATAKIAADGTVTEAALSKHILNIVTRNLALDYEKMNYTIDGEVLVSTMSKENAKTILGVDAAGDVTLNIITANAKVTGIAMLYSTANGTVSITCTYSY